MTKQLNATQHAAKLNIEIEQICRIMSHIVRNIHLEFRMHYFVNSSMTLYLYTHQD